MRIHSYIKVCLAVLAIAFAITIGTVPGSTRMQPQVTTANVTQILVQCGPNPYGLVCAPYDRIAPDRWVQRTQDGKVLNYVEVSRGVNTLSLFNGASPGEKVFGTRLDFDFSGMSFSGGSTSLVSPNVAVGGSFGGGVITGVYEVSSDSSPETCRRPIANGLKCNCELRTLRPLQGAVGQDEVKKKKEDIELGEKTRLDLAFDPIKLVRGPNGLYVTDHHHGAKAWIEAGHTMGTCQIQSDTLSSDPTQFWTDLKNLKLVRLANERGETITETQLPKKLMDLPDDPYRTLAWMVRKKNGFCRDLMKGNTEFAEFKWADWFRTRPELPYDKVKASPKNMRPKALELATSVAARDKDLPGYHGNPTPPYICGPDPD